jgi:release factor glutamine methyltransferase
MRVLDLCTGTGCIPLLLAKLWPRGTVDALGVDVSADAVRLARENADDYALHGQGQGLPAEDKNTATFVHADILSSSFAQQLLNDPLFRPGFHLITSNPPYIPLHEYVTLDRSVKDFEDPRALLGDPVCSNLDAAHLPAQDADCSDLKGLTFYRAIARLAAWPGVLLPGAPLVLEVGAGQASDVEHILRRTASPGTQAFGSDAPEATASATFTKTEQWTDAWGVQRVVVGWRSA